MDKFHELLELVDKNATRIPEGDYIKMCNIIKHIHSLLMNFLGITKIVSHLRVSRFPFRMFGT